MTVPCVEVIVIEPTEDIDILDTGKYYVSWSMDAYEPVDWASRPKVNIYNAAGFTLKVDIKNISDRELNLCWEGTAEMIVSSEKKTLIAYQTQIGVPSSYYCAWPPCPPLGPYLSGDTGEIVSHFDALSGKLGYPSWEVVGVYDLTVKLTYAGETIQRTFPEAIYGSMAP